MYVSSLLIGLLASATASPVLTGGNTHPVSLQARAYEDPAHAYEWAGFHQVSQQYEKAGNCRIYSDPDVSRERDGTWPCQGYCKSIGEEGGALGCHAPGDVDPKTGQFVDPNPPFHTPDGDEFSVGKCICSNDAKDKISEIAGEALILIGQVTCHVWLEAAKQSVNLLASLPNPGSAGVRALITVAKVADKAATVDSVTGGNHFDDFTRQACGTDPEFDLYKDVNFGEVYEKVKNL